MIRTFHYRRFHRRLAVFVGVQLLFWTVSGLYFAWSDLDEIHGDHHRAPRPTIAIEAHWISPSAIPLPAGGA